MLYRFLDIAISIPHHFGIHPMPPLRLILPRIETIQNHSVAMMLKLLIGVVFLLMMENPVMAMAMAHGILEVRPMLLEGGTAAGTLVVLSVVASDVATVMMMVMAAICCVAFFASV